MIFPRCLSWTILRGGKRFSLQNILSIPSALIGVYVFHHSRTFVYVGQSHDIRSRLRQHYDGSHSKQLRMWLDALDGDVKFNYFDCVNADVDDLEKSMIRFLQPFANEHLYGKYRPKPTNWRKIHV